MGTPLQPSLISVDSGNSQVVLELFPEIWQIAEKISSPNLQTRQKALAELRKTKAARVSPLIAYLLATRILDPEVKFRTSVVEDVSKVMQVDDEGKHAEDAVRTQVVSTLSSLDKSGLMALVEAAVYENSQIENVITLVNYVPNAGEMLREFAADRQLDISIRMMAITLLGQVGYVAALPELERIQNRLQTRQQGQQSMPFAPAQKTSELELLPSLKRSILILRSMS